MASTGQDAHVILRLLRLGSLPTQTDLNSIFTSNRNAALSQNGLSFTSPLHAPSHENGPCHTEMASATHATPPRLHSPQDTGGEHTMPPRHYGEFDRLKFWIAGSVEMIRLRYRRLASLSPFEAIS